MLVLHAFDITNRLSFSFFLFLSLAFFSSLFNIQDVVNPTCVRNCNGNGLCTNGTCSCYANFSGSACDRGLLHRSPFQHLLLPRLLVFIFITEIQQILAQVNGTEAKLQLGTQVYFNLKLKSISEVALNSSVISTYAIQTQNVETISESIYSFLIFTAS